jgi:hypothetical protein
MKFKFEADNTYSYYSSESRSAGTGRWQVFSTSNKDGVVYYSLVLFGKSQKQKSNRFVIDDFNTSPSKLLLSDASSCPAGSASSWFPLHRNNRVEIDLHSN